MVGTLLRSGRWAALVALLLAPPAFGAISAQFTDGNDNTNGGVAAPTPDSFTGSAGGGWVGPWQWQFDGGTSVAGTVVNTTPLGGGGNYLKVNGTMSQSVNSNSTAVRQYASVAGGPQLNQPHTISFKFRVDDDLSTFNNDNNDSFDRYRFYEDRVAAAGTNNTDDWIIAAFGGPFAFANGANPTKRWLFMSGSSAGSGFGNLTWIDTGYDLVTGRVYSFSVTTDPTNRSWSATVSDDAGSTPFTATSLNWRNVWEATPRTESGGFLCFGYNANTTADARAYSLDAVNVDLVPEPAALSLLAAGALGFLRRRAR